MRALRILLAAIFAVAGGAASAGTSLWSHVERVEDLGELRRVRAQWEGSALGGLLTVQSEGGPGYSWVTIPPPKAGWNLGRSAAVEAEIRNRGHTAAKVLLWVVGDHGWDAVTDLATLAPGASRLFSCRLRELFPDGTPLLDPGQVKQIQVMLTGGSAAIEVRGLAAVGDAPDWIRPPGRLETPSPEEGLPRPGKRVRYRLEGDAQDGVSCLLHLPEDWKPTGRYPVIVEFPGNIYFVKGSYSTGLPDQCIIGFGMSQGRGAICLGLPFVNRQAGGIAEHGWGNPDQTVDYALRMVDEVCARFGGDRANLVLTGFSRGAIACGFIGLRNERIAALWKGIHACQHYDGDGWGGAVMEGAIERAGRFRGQAAFQTDNPPDAVRPVMEAMRARVSFAQSGLGAHATAMFLDDRPSTRELRQWFTDLVKAD